MRRVFRLWIIITIETLSRRCEHCNTFVGSGADLLKYSRIPPVYCELALGSLRFYCCPNVTYFLTHSFRISSNRQTRALLANVYVFRGKENLLPPSKWHYSYARVLLLQSHKNALSVLRKILFGSPIKVKYKKYRAHISVILRATERKSELFNNEMKLRFLLFN